MTVRSTSHPGRRRLSVLALVALLLGSAVFMGGASAHADRAPQLTEVSRSLDMGNGIEIEASALIDPSLTNADTALDALLPGSTSPDAGRVTAAYVVNSPWEAEDIPVPVSYDDEFDPPGVSGRPVVQRAMSVWNEVPAQSFRYIDGGTTSAFAGSDCSSDEPDGVNSVRFSYLLPSGVLGSTCSITTKSPNGPRHMLEFDMVFDGTTDWSVADTTPQGLYDLKSTVLHELGHALGLAHSGVPGAVMKPLIDSGQQVRTPTADDVAGIRALYGVAATPTPATPTPATPTPATPTTAITPTPTAVPPQAQPSATPGVPAVSLTFHLRVPVVAADSVPRSTSPPPPPPVSTKTPLPTPTVAPTQPPVADSISELSDADEFVMLWNDIRTARMTSSASGVAVYLQSWSADGFSFYDNGLGDQSHVSVDFYFGSTAIGSEDLYVAIYGTRITVYRTTNNDFTAVYNTTWSGAGQVIAFTVPRSLFPAGGSVHWDVTGAEARFTPDCSYSDCSWFDYDWVPELLLDTPHFELR
ncbi:MAG: matrixin family metalloprotease [Tepidiformaceae bacterium]